jgi:dihydroorotase
VATVGAAPGRPAAAACADSAPHPVATKLSVNGMPGIFNAPVCM